MACSGVIRSFFPVSNSLTLVAREREYGSKAEAGFEAEELPVPVREFDTRILILRFLPFVADFLTAKY